MRGEQLRYLGTSVFMAAPIKGGGGGSKRLIRMWGMEPGICKYRALLVPLPRLESRELQVTRGHIQVAANGVGVICSAHLQDTGHQRETFRGSGGDSDTGPIRWRWDLPCLLFSSSHDTIKYPKHPAHKSMYQHVRLICIGVGT